MRLNVPLFAQRDPRWASKKLGNSTTSTIGDYGCAVACVAMLCSYYGKNTDVGKLNDDMKDNEGFDGPYIIWQNVNKLYSDITFTRWEDYPNDPAPVDRIRNQLNDGKPVIVWVDINPNQPGNQMHFVILTGIEGQDFYCNDPWYGDSILFSSRYGDPLTGLLGHRFYSGPVPSAPTGNLELEECLRQHSELVTKCDTLEKEIASLTHELEGEQSKVTSYENWQKQLSITLSCENQQPNILGKIVELIAVEDTLRNTEKTLKETQETLVKAQDDLKTTKDALTVKQQLLEASQAEISAKLEIISNLQKKEGQLLEEINKLKNEHQNIYKQLVWRFYLRTD